MSQVKYLGASFDRRNTYRIFMEMIKGMPSYINQSPLPILQIGSPVWDVGPTFTLIKTQQYIEAASEVWSHL